MKISPKQYARSLYEVVAEMESENDIRVAVKNFVRVVVRGRQTSKLNKIIHEFNTIWNKERSIVEGELVSAKKISEETMELLNSYIIKLLNVENVELDNKVDENILGGFVAKLGDTVIDGSVKSQLQNLKHKLSN